MTFSRMISLKLGEQESLYHDLLRILLISQVIVGHVVVFALPQMPQLLAYPGAHLPEIVLKLLTRYGPQAAYIFVFLSGYMVAGPLMRDAMQDKALSFREFVQRRLKRLLPGVFVGLIVTVLLDGYGIYIFEKVSFYRSVANTDAVSNYSLVNLIGNIFFLEPTFVPAFGSNGPLWTLGYIFQYYLAGFAVFRLMSFKAVYGAVAALLLLAGFAFIRPEWSVLFAVWLLGGLIRNLSFSGIPAFVLVLAAIALTVTSNAFPPLLSAAASGPAGALLVFGLRGGGVPAINTFDGFIRLAASKTYLAYAVHFPILVLGAAYLGGRYPPLALLAILTLWLLAVMFAIIVLGHFVKMRAVRHAK